MRDIDQSLGHSSAEKSAGSGVILVSIIFLSLALCAGVSAYVSAQKPAKEGLPAADLKPSNFGVMLDATKVEGAMACAECHPNANMVWQKSVHGESFKTRHRSRKARKIADRMGIRRFRAKDSLCTACHTTQQQPDAMEDAMAISGPSCESCHGESQEWVHDHFDFGGAMTRMEETPEHRAKRLSMLEKRGMVHPSKLFDLAERCYSCHVIDNNSLVEVGGHPASSEFALIEWTQGEIRHNFVDSKSAKNAEAPVSHRRQMVVIEATLEVLSGLGQIAAGPKDSELRLEGIDRIDSAHFRLNKISEAFKDEAPKTLSAFLTQSKETFKQLQTGGFKKAEIEKQSADLRKQAMKLATALQAKEIKLDALDSFLPDAEEYKGDVWQPKKAE